MRFMDVAQSTALTRECRGLVDVVVIHRCETLHIEVLGAFEGRRKPCPASRRAPLSTASGQDTAEVTSLVSRPAVPR